MGIKFGKTWSNRRANKLEYLSLPMVDPIAGRSPDSLDVAVVIPSYNEESSVGQVVRGCLDNLGDLRAEVIVVDDGSTDETVNVAQKAGARVIRHKVNKGVAQAVRSGLNEAIRENPRAIVQLDADGQHDPKDITEMIRPILEDKADLVIGTRIYQGWKPRLSRRFGNWLLTKVTNQLAGTRVRDAQTGFRAMTPEVASRLRLTSGKTYVREMIIRASREGYRISEVEVRVTPREVGQSKAVKSVVSYASGAIITMIRIYRDYEPLRFFGGFGVSLAFIGIVLGFLLVLTREALPWLSNNLGFRTVFLLITVGLQIILFGFLADMMRNGK
jgi:glycosyltransferase involved in cell wall biosynthesis